MVPQWRLGIRPRDGAAIEQEHWRPMRRRPHWNAVERVVVRTELAVAEYWGTVEDKDIAIADHAAAVPARSEVPKSSTVRDGVSANWHGWRNNKNLHPRSSRAIPAEKNGD